MRVRDGYFEVFQFDLPSVLDLQKNIIKDLNKDLDENDFFSSYINPSIPIQATLDFFESIKRNYQELRDLVKKQNKQNLPIKLIIVGETDD